MNVVSPKDQERYFLRLLLCNVKGATSWEDLYRVGDDVCTTFRDAAKRRGLLQDDADCVSTMEDAALSSIPDALRQLFVILLIERQIGDVKQLWDQFNLQMAEDYPLQAREISRNPALPMSDAVLRECVKYLKRS
jgi:ATP-dependent DNA helicase PIF1